MRIGKMSIFKSITTVVSTPIRCLGELGKDLSSLTDVRKDETDGILAIANNGNPDFDAKKYAQKALSAKFKKYLNGE